VAIEETSRPYGVLAAHSRRSRLFSPQEGKFLEAVAYILRAAIERKRVESELREMDGYEATQAIRQRERNPHEGCGWKSPIHIIAMTADALQANAEKCLLTGMNDYLSKPVRLPELTAALERWKQPIQ
jgi:CheY-like chemotaxis protein